MYLYLPVREALYSPYLGFYHAYGILCIHVGRRGLRRADSVADVSPSFRFAARLAVRCTLGRLSPLHLRDVIEDSL